MPKGNFGIFEWILLIQTQMLLLLELLLELLRLLLLLLHVFITEF